MLHMVVIGDSLLFNLSTYPCLSIHTSAGMTAVSLSLSLSRIKASLQPQN